MPRSGSASGSAPATPASQADGAAPAESGRQTRKRVERPEIDLDGNIREARATIQRAQAALTQASIRLQKLHAGLGSPLTNVVS